MADSRTGSFSMALLVTSAALLGACGDNDPAEAQASSSAGANGGGGGTGGAGSGAGGSTGGGGSAVACPLGSSWSLVDDFVFSPGEPSNVVAVAAGPSGEVYVTGVVKQGGNFLGMTRKSIDGGATWETVEGVDPVTDQPLGGSGVVVDPNGVVFMIGAVSGARVVWRSDDGGATYERIDELPIPTETPCNTGAIARAPDGTLYTLASCDETGWVVRRGDDGGARWSTVDTFELVAGHRARSGGIFVDASGRPFASGQAQDMLDVNHWVVRSPAGDGTWTTVDEYQLVEGMHASAASLGGRTGIHAVGAAAIAPPDFTGSHWVVRSFDGARSTWSTADDYAPTTSTSAARALYEDPAGALLVVGSVDEGDLSSPGGPAVARRSDDGGATWEDVDEYSYVAGKPTAPVQMTSDPAGNVYVTVRGLDEANNPHWLVRKLSCD